MRILLVPEGERPRATTLVPTEIESDVAGAMDRLNVPVWSTRTARTAPLPTRTVTTERPRNPTPDTDRRGAL